MSRAPAPLARLAFFGGRSEAGGACFLCPWAETESEMKTLDNITLTRVHSAIIPVHKTGARHHIERRASYAVSFSLGGRITVSDTESVVIHPMGESYDFLCTEGGAFAVINFYTSHFFTNEFIRVQMKCDALRTRFSEIREALLRGGAHHRVMRLTYEILEMICEATESGGTLVRSALREMRASFSDAGFGVGALAASLYVSESYLRRIFAEEVGMPPKKYLISMRISHAKQLLRDGGESIGRVAEKSGFSGVYHFCRAFREEVGQTPTQYRAECRRMALLGGFQM